MSEGNASQYSLGIRFFPVAGVNLSVHYRKSEETPKDADTFSYSEGLLQAHLYF